MRSSAILSFDSFSGASDDLLLFEACGLSRALLEVRRMKLLADAGMLSELPELESLLIGVFDRPFDLFRIDIHPAAACGAIEESGSKPGIRVRKPTDRLRALVSAMRASEADLVRLGIWEARL